MSDRGTRTGDEILASWVLVDGSNEIALSRIAEQRAQDPEVKQFARMIVEDHREIARKLEAFTKTEARGDEITPRDASARPTGEFDHLALIQDLGQQCLATARKELESKSGTEFDRCYMGMMLGGHMKANDMLTVFQRHSTSGLQKVLGESQPTVVMHLRKAKDLVRRLETGQGVKATDEEMK